MGFADDRKAMLLAILALGVVASPCGCGGGGGSSGSSPTTSSTPQPSLAAGTVLAVLAGDTGAPVAGATLSIGESTLRTGTDGQATLASPAPVPSRVDISADGFLNRQTLLRSQQETRFTLWPDNEFIPSEYTRAIVYRHAAGRFDELGQPKLLWRMEPGTVRVVPLPSVARNPESMEIVAEAVDIVNELTRSQQILFTLSGESSRTVTLAINPTISSAGLCRRSVSGNVITGAALEFFGPIRRQDGDYNVTRTTVVHEMGHVLGFEHPPNSAISYGDMMFGEFTYLRYDSFSEREHLIFSLMHRRRPGNAFPDNDRDPRSAGSSTTRIVCDVR